MTDLDLTAVIAAAERAYLTGYFGGAPAVDARSAAIAAAAPLIVAQVRAQIAADIEADADRFGEHATLRHARIKAARIARGES